MPARPTRRSSASRYTVAEHLARFRDPSVEVPPYFDGDLRDLFHPAGAARRARARARLSQEARAADREASLSLDGRPRRGVRSLLDHLAERAQALNLQVDARRGERALIDVLAYVTTLCMNYLYKGAFFPGAGAGKW